MGKSGIPSPIHLEVDDQIIGKLVAIYPIGLIDDEYNFLQTIQLYIYAAVCLTILLSIIFSMLFSKKLTSGLNKAFLCSK